jgi:hypothetical protein
MSETDNPTAVVKQPLEHASAAKSRLTAAQAFLGRHWLFVVLFGAGVVLRLITSVAYRPALLNSAEYLISSQNLRPQVVHPVGYPLFVRVIPFDHRLWIIALVQHLLGLAVAILLYALLVRLGVRRWLAALAAAAVLLDAYQLGIEHYVTPEALFELLLLGGCTLLLWRRPLDTPAAGAAGLLFAAAALTRTIGALAAVPALLAIVFLRAGWVRAVVFAACVALPLLAYAGWYHSAPGRVALRGSDGKFLYSRVVSFVECDEFSKPAYEQVFCPREPVGERVPINEVLWSPDFSVFRRIDSPPGKTGDDVASDFAKRAIVHQPLDYAQAVGADVLRAFAPTRGTAPGEYGEPPWQFHAGYPVFLSGSVCSPEAFEEVRQSLRLVGETVAEQREARCKTRRKKIYRWVRLHDDGPLVSTRLTSFLRAYQKVGYAPGPLLAAGLLVGLVAAAGIGRARGSGLRSAAFLFAGVAAAVCLASVFVTFFSWRYQLPQLVLLPASLAIGMTALTGRRHEDDAADSERDP